MTERNLRDLQDRLTDAFINYQYRLERPMPNATETLEIKHARYLNDPMFHARVTSLTAGVTDIVIKWLETEDE